MIQERPRKFGEFRDAVLHRPPFDTEPLGQFTTEHCGRDISRSQVMAHQQITVECAPHRTVGTLNLREIRDDAMRVEVRVVLTRNIVAVGGDHQAFTGTIRPSEDARRSIAFQVVDRGPDRNVERVCNLGLERRISERPQQ